MLSEIQLAIASITGAKTIVDGLASERDSLKLMGLATALNTKLIEAQTALLNAQRDQALLHEELARLKKENSELADRLERIERASQQYIDYELATIANDHCVVYAAKKDEAGMRHPPYLCATCFQEGKSAALNFEMGTQKDPGRRLVCPVSAKHTLKLPPGGWTLENLGKSFKKT